MKHIILALMCIILASCNEKILDLDNNYVLYIKDFGKDPILIEDATYQAPNKNRLVIYPKEIINYKVRSKRYVTRDHESIALEIKISYLIADPISFHRNNIKIESLNYEISSSIKKSIESFFYDLPYETILEETIKRNNVINKELSDHVVSNYSLKNSIDKKIDGIEIISLEILTEKVLNEIDERSLSEIIKEVMMDKS